jgi:hypothetical protein
MGPEVDDSYWRCGVNGETIGQTEMMTRKNVTTKYCPLKRIELKDGTVFVPEVIE